MNYRKFFLTIFGLILIKFFAPISAITEISFECGTFNPEAREKFTTDSQKVVGKIEDIWKCGRKHFKNSELNSGYKQCIKDLGFSEFYENKIAELGTSKFDDSEVFSREMNKISFKYCIELNDWDVYPANEHLVENKIKPIKNLKFEEVTESEPKTDSETGSGSSSLIMIIVVLVVLVLIAIGVSIWLFIKLRSLQPNTDPKNDRASTNLSSSNPAAPNQLNAPHPYQQYPPAFNQQA